MSKHRKTGSVYQPSDCMTVLAIGVAAIILVLSLFAMERFAGVPVSVRGEPVYGELTSSRRRVRPVRVSRAAQRRADRLSRSRQTTGAAAAPTATVNTSACADTACGNLIATFVKGDPACMRLQQCVDSVYRTISQANCAASKSCGQLSAMYSFYFSNQSCIADVNAWCKGQIDVILQSYR